MDKWAFLQRGSSDEALCREGSTGNISTKDGTSCAPEYTFYVFNLSFTEGCVNFYTALEVFFLDRKVDSKRTKLNRLCAELNI